MLTIGIRELRQHASRYLRLVRQGQRVGITNRGTLVAQLVPVGESESELDRLAAAGEYRAGIGDLLAVPEAADDGRESSLGQVLRGQRDEERW